MEYIKEEDLIIGEVYADLDNEDGAVYLRLISKNDNSLFFKHVSGDEIYKVNEEGLISFPKFGLYFYR